MDVKKLLDMAGIKPNNQMDQHFLKDDTILDTEVDLAKLKKTDTVLEVGPGIGSLTIRLCKKAQVLAIEKDYAFTRILKGIPNSNVIFGDALEVLESLRKNDKKIFNKIVSNIPYSISQDLVIEFFRHPWDTAVICVQKEFADKLKSKEKLGLILSELADIKIIGQVPADAFYPRAVPSSIVLLEQKKQIDFDFWTFASRLKPNKDVSNQVKKAPKELAKKKTHQLTLAELKKLYKIQKEN